METLGELKIGDTFYLIHWNGNHISTFETKTVQDIIDTKIGMNIYYGENINDIFVIEFNKFKETVYKIYFETEVCSDKNVLLEMIDRNYKRVFYNNYDRFIPSII